MCSLKKKKKIHNIINMPSLIILMTRLTPCYLLLRNLNNRKDKDRKINKDNFEKGNVGTKDNPLRK